jgi:hypothetical protein
MLSFGSASGALRYQVCRLLDVRACYVWFLLDQGYQEIRLLQPQRYRTGRVPNWPKREGESQGKQHRGVMQLQGIQSEQTTFVLAQLASVREDNLKLVELQMKQSEKIADMSQKQSEKIADMSQKQSEKIADMSQKLAEAMGMLEETFLRLGSIKRESSESPSEQKS